MAPVAPVLDPASPVAPDENPTVPVAPVLKDPDPARLDPEV